MKKIILPFVLLGIFNACGLYEDNFEYPLIPQVKVSKSYPGIVDFQLIQTINTPENTQETEAVTLINIINTSTDIIDSLTYFLNIYNSENHTSENLLFTNSNTVTNLSSIFTDTISTRFSGKLEEEFIELEILKLSINENHFLSGLYDGNYISTFNQDTLNTGVTTAFIDYQGKCKIQMPNFSSFKIIEGNITSDGKLLAVSKDKNLTNVYDSIKGVVVKNNDKLNMTLVFNDSNTLNLDTLHFSFSNL